MKRTLMLFAALAVAAAMSACSTSPRTASIEDGKVTNITSAEAVTLVKQDTRRKKVEDVQKNAKPLLKIEAHAGQPITINAKSIEVNAPQDIRELLAEQPDSVSENVQMAREVVNGIKASTPAVMGGLALADRNNARSAATRQAEIQAESQVEMETLRSQERQDARQNPIVLTIPAGGSASVLQTD